MTSTNERRFGGAMLALTVIGGLFLYAACCMLIATKARACSIDSGERSSVGMRYEPHGQKWARVGAINAAREAYAGMVSSAAFAAGVPAHIAHGVIRSESNYNPNVRGRAGEYGIGQIKCQTARGVGFTGNCSELFDAATNLRFSMAYLRQALDKGGAGCAGATLYNTGIGARPHCSAYGRAVMQRAG